MAGSPIVVDGVAFRRWDGYERDPTFWEIDRMVREMNPGKKVEVASVERGGYDYRMKYLIGDMVSTMAFRRLDEAFAQNSTPTQATQTVQTVNPTSVTSTTITTTSSVTNNTRRRLLQQVQPTNFPFTLSGSALFADPTFSFLNNFLMSSLGNSLSGAQPLNMTISRDANGLNYDFNYQLPNRNIQNVRLSDSQLALLNITLPNRSPVTPTVPISPQPQPPSRTTSTVTTTTSSSSSTIPLPTPPIFIDPATQGFTPVANYQTNSDIRTLSDFVTSKDPRKVWSNLVGVWQKSNELNNSVDFNLVYLMAPDGRREPTILNVPRKTESAAPQTTVSRNTTTTTTTPAGISTVEQTINSTRVSEIRIPGQVLDQAKLNYSDTESVLAFLRGLGVNTPNISGGNSSVTTTTTNRPGQGSAGSTVPTAGTVSSTAVGQVNTQQTSTPNPNNPSQTTIQSPQPAANPSPTSFNPSWQLPPLIQSSIP